MLPLIIISVYSLYRFQKDTAQTIEARNRNLVYQIKTQADSMFHTVDVITNFLSGSTSVSNSLQTIFLNDILSSATAKQASTLAQYLLGIVQSNEYSHSSYLYYDNDFGRYIATSNVLSYIRNYSTDNRLNRYLDSPTDFWYEATKISTYSLARDKEVFAIYQKLYSPYSSALPQGILVIYFDMDSFRDYIDNSVLYPGQIILFIQEDSAPLFQTSEDDFTDIWTQIAPNLNAGDTYNNFTVKYNGLSYRVSLMPASETGLYYASLIPNEALSQQTRPLTNAFFLIAATACILSIFLSLIAAGKEYNQLQTFIDLFNNADNGLPHRQNSPVKTSDPYQIILHNIINLFLEQNYLKLQLDNKQYQIQLLKLRTLQHQINPHFLFNTLNTIYWESIRLTESPNTCSSMISKLSEIISYSLTDVHGKVPVRKELEYLQHYTDILRIRYDNKFEVIWDIDDDTYDMSIIKMALQPLVENAIYHGIKEKEGNGVIKVKIYHQNNSIVIHILDNGLGIMTDKLSFLKKQLSTVAQENEEHIGLLNTNRRLILTYGESSAIRLYSHYGIGTIVSFSIPVE